MRPTPVVPRKLAFVVKWSAVGQADAIADELASRLAQARVAATWAIEQPAQAGRLQAAAGRTGVDAALLINESIASRPGAERAKDVSYEIRRRLDDIRGTGVTVAAVQTSEKRPAALDERRLRELGVRAIIAETAGRVRHAVAPRSLPFGMWQVSPRISVPVLVGWQRFVDWRRRVALTLAEEAPTIVAVELAQIKSLESRDGRALEALIAQAIEASRRGAVALATVSEIVAELAESQVARPQRSILRVAA